MASTQLFFVLMTLAALVSALVAIPYKRTVLDEKDIFCLLTCAECFDDGKQEDLLMSCVNKLCPFGLKNLAAMSHIWLKKCPQLENFML